MSARPIYTAWQVVPGDVRYERAASVPLRKPRLWPGPETRPTTVQAVWSTAGLHVAFRMADGFDVAPDDPTDKRSLEYNDRVEVFLQPVADVPRYWCYEINAAGHILDYAAPFGTPRRFDYGWHGTATPRVTRDGAATRLEVLIPWRDLGIEGTPPSGMRIGFFRGTPYQRPDGRDAFLWSSWVDPGLAAVNFHCPETFAELQLRGLPGVAK